MGVWEVYAWWTVEVYWKEKPGVLGEWVHGEVCVLVCVLSGMEHSSGSLGILLSTHINLPTEEQHLTGILAYSLFGFRSSLPFSNPLFLSPYPVLLSLFHQSSTSSFPSPSFTPTFLVCPTVSHYSFPPSVRHHSFPPSLPTSHSFLLLLSSHLSPPGGY